MRVQSPNIIRDAVLFGVGFFYIQEEFQPSETVWTNGSSQSFSLGGEKENMSKTFGLFDLTTSKQVKGFCSSSKPFYVWRAN